MFLRNSCRLPERFHAETEAIQRKLDVGRGKFVRGATGCGRARCRLALHMDREGLLPYGFGWTDERSHLPLRGHQSRFGSHQRQFNAAEVDSVRVSAYPGLRIARVTRIRARYRGSASLGPLDDAPIPMIAYEPAVLALRKRMSWLQSDCLPDSCRTGNPPCAALENSNESRDRMTLSESIARWIAGRVWQRLRQKRAVRHCLCPPAWHLSGTICPGNAESRRSQRTCAPRSPSEYGSARLFAIPVNDPESSYQYPERVRIEIEQEDEASYERAAEFLNFNGNDLVCLQHEYGIFGGPAGSHILSLLRRLKMPLVTTLHTVLREPDLNQRDRARRDRAAFRPPDRHERARCQPAARCIWRFRRKRST